MAQTSFPTTSTIMPTAPHSHTIIFLHGRGSDAATFQEEVFETQDSNDAFFKDIFPGIKWVFPEAKKRWAEVDKEEMHQWFDMESVRDPWRNAQEQQNSLFESIEQILSIVETEAEFVGSKNVILAGISQGCATATYILLTSGIELGGFFGLCGWLPSVEETETTRTKHLAKQIPVLLQHCEDDDVVPIANGQDLRERLGMMGFEVQWQSFEEGGHWLNEPNGMDGIVRFIWQIIHANEEAGT
ncbi:Phospholipase/carboxylesterase/thioesterase [Paraphoma chrysanthemicola]|uniref:Phospholipase/carboxylesterase/thioesterase n=1 Tax=Paraphoma chrysanthemicola TaxID=798071 RepID=A0A8K0R860_9PLEO|nr:Phospholipase/carboxylesterase/thioesterase [Paraphoma chrysanthemicola]